MKVEYLRVYYTPKFLSFLLRPPSTYKLQAHSIIVVLHHTHQHTHTHTLSMTPPKDESVRRRDLYLTAHDTHKRKTSTSPSGIETANPASERPQTHALYRAATANDTLLTSLAFISGCKYTTILFLILPRKTNTTINQLLTGFLQ